MRVERNIARPQPLTRRKLQPNFRTIFLGAVFFAIGLGVGWNAKRHGFAGTHYPAAVISVPEIMGKTGVETQAPEAHGQLANEEFEALLEAVLREESPWLREERLHELAQKVAAADIPKAISLVVKRHDLGALSLAKCYSVVGLRPSQGRRRSLLHT